MNTTDAMRVPLYYRRPRVVALLRAVAAGPCLADCVAGAVFAGIVLALLLAHTAQHRAPSSASAVVITTPTDGHVDADGVAYIAQSSMGQK